MKRNKILSSAFVMTMVSFGAFGADKIITSANTCTVDVLGVSDNNAVANTIATWDLIDYTLNPGQYLNVTETSVDKTTCPAGSYCVGGGYTVETANNSIAQCPTGYPNSDAGAGAQTQCYTTCTVANTNIAHATAVGGNDYYGAGTDTCYATACAQGYHVDGEITIIEKTPLIPVDAEIVANGAASINANGDARNDNFPDSGLTENNTFAGRFDYGTVYGRASCQPTVDPAMTYTMNNAEALFAGTMTFEEFHKGLSSVSSSAATIKAISDFIRATLIVMDEEITESEMIWLAGKNVDQMWEKFSILGLETGANYSTDSTGQNCYCQMVGYQPTGGERTSVTSAPWCNYTSYATADECADACAFYCSFDLFRVAGDPTFERKMLFGAVDYVETGTCAANTINIDWNPDNGGDHIKNMCTYDGSVTLPTPDPVKPGYTFTGWKLVE